MSKKKQKNKFQLMILTNKESDAINGFLNGTVDLIVERGGENKRAIINEYAHILAHIAMSEGFRSFLNKFDKARHEAGYCNDKNCKSEYKFKPTN